MARSNGPFGPPGTRAPLRRHPADDPFAPQPGGQPPGQWPQAFPNAGQAPQQGQGYHFPTEPEPNYGYGQPPQPQPQWGQQPDPGGYDLGNYMPVGGQAYQPDPNQFPPPDPQGHYGPAQQRYVESDPDYDDEFLDDEPRSGRRWMLIVAALVGAIGVGGALAYTYKSFIAPSGRVPLVKAGDPKVKIKPESRGGREFPNADKKMLSRLEESDQQQKEPDPADDRTSDEGPKRVRTIAITPGAGPPAAQQPPPSVPGIMLDVRPPRVPQPPPKAAQPPPQQRVTIGQPPPPPPPPAEAEDPPPARRAVAAVQPPPVAKPPPPPRAKEAAPAANTTGAGYVAVLSSQKSRMQALQVFADLQQKYGDVLGTKTPDVQEADLSDRGLGTMYRLVVGPPGSRESASGICSQLKTAGLQGCWVKEY